MPAILFLPRPGAWEREGFQFSLAGPQLTLSRKPNLRSTAGEDMIRPRELLTAAASFAPFLAATCLLAADWPQWRGPERNGISKETGLLSAWPKDGPKLLWQVNDIGYGYSTPAVVGERLYLVSNKGLDDEFVQALEVKSGKQVWAHAHRQRRRAKTSSELHRGEVNANYGRRNALRPQFGRRSGLPGNGDG